jgi:DNA-binding response OmpR family regulator
MLARLRSIIRRSTGHASSLVRVGYLTFNETNMTISIRGTPIDLSPLEYRAVAYLIVHRGRVISQQELSENVYGQSDAHESNAIEVLVGRVRKKLGADLIETRRGFGYFVSEKSG